MNELLENLIARNAADHRELLELVAELAKRVARIEALLEAVAVDVLEPLERDDEIDIKIPLEMHTKCAN
jgi:hypothetical protein